MFGERSSLERICFYPRVFPFKLVSKTLKGCFFFVDTGIKFIPQLFRSEH